MKSNMLRIHRNINILRSNLFLEIDNLVLQILVIATSAAFVQLGRRLQFLILTEKTDKYSNLLTIERTLLYIDA